MSLTNHTVHKNATGQSYASRQGNQHGSPFSPQQDKKQQQQQLLQANPDEYFRLLNQHSLGTEYPSQQAQLNAMAKSGSNGNGSMGVTLTQQWARVLDSTTSTADNNKCRINESIQG
jgi:hypothetical protein